MGDVIKLDTVTGATFEVNAETRTIKGLVLPYNAVGNNGWGKYSFGKGTVTWPTDLSRVKLLVNHDFGQAIGYATALEETDAGVVGTFKVARGAAGDQALSMAEDKVWDGLSAGLGVDSKFADAGDGVQAAIAAPLAETSLTPLPAFEDARVTAVAASAAHTERNPSMTETTETGPQVVTFSAEHAAQLSAVAGQVADLAAKVDTLAEIKAPVAQVATQLQVAEEPIYRFSGTERAPSGFDFAEDLYKAAVRADEAALARLQEFTATRLGPSFAPDGVIKTGDTTQINQPTYRPDMFVGQAPVPASPLYDYFHKGTISNVQPFFWSKLDRTNTTVGVHDHVEGTDPAADDLTTVTGTTVTPTAVSGKVHITREVADQGGNPQVSGLVWSEFERSLKIALETKTYGLINAAMASIATLATIATATTGPNAGLAVEGGLVDLQFAVDGYRFERAFGHQDLYKALGLAANGNGEKIYPILSPTNRDGQTADKFARISIAGYEMYPAASLGATGGTKNSLVADPAAVHVWNSGLQRLEKLQEKVEGWDIGCFGYFAGVLYDLTGLRKIVYTP